MHHGVLALLLLLSAPANGFKLGISYDIAHGPHLAIPRRSGNPVHRPLHRPGFRRLVARGAEEIPKPPHANGGGLRSFDLNVAPDLNSEVPSATGAEKQPLERLNLQLPSSRKRLQRPPSLDEFPNSGEPSSAHERFGSYQPPSSQPPTKKARRSRKKKPAPERQKEVHELLSQSTLDGKSGYNPHVHVVPSWKRNKTKLKGLGEPRNFVLYHMVIPDPHRHQGVRNVRTGAQSYYRKIYDSLEDNKVMYEKLGHVHTNSPTKSMALSGGQQEGYQGLRPAKYEENVTMNPKGFSSWPEWYRITPKTADQLPPNSTPWTDEQLRQNLVKQKAHFGNHEAGQPNSEYARLDQEMRAMCNTTQCRIQPPKGLARPGQPRDSLGRAIRRKGYKTGRFV